MSESELRLREAVNVPDLIARDKLVRRIRKMRREVELDRGTILHWNATHPNEKQFSTVFVDAFLAWCDGEATWVDVLAASATAAALDAERESEGNDGA